MGTNPLDAPAGAAQVSDKTAFFNQAITLCDELSMTLRSSNRSEYAGLALTVGLVRGELDRQRMWETAQDARCPRRCKLEGVVMCEQCGRTWA